MPPALRRLRSLADTAEGEIGQRPSVRTSKLARTNTMAGTQMYAPAAALPSPFPQLRQFDFPAGGRVGVGCLSSQFQSEIMSSIAQPTHPPILIPCSLTLVPASAPQDQQRPQCGHFPRCGERASQVGRGVVTGWDHPCSHPVGDTCPPLSRGTRGADSGGRREQPAPQVEQPAQQVQVEKEGRERVG